MLVVFATTTACVAVSVSVSVATASDRRLLLLLLSGDVATVAGAIMVISMGRYYYQRKYSVVADGEKQFTSIAPKVERQITAFHIRISKFRRQPSAKRGNGARHSRAARDTFMKDPSRAVIP